MKNIFKKNQIIITTLAILMAVSGYINYAGNIKNNEAKKNESQTTNDAVDNDSMVEPGDAILTSTIVNKAAEIKLNREQIRAKNLESLYEVVNNQNVSEKQKEEAIASVNAIVEQSEMELAVEILLEAKGYNSVVASVNDEGIDIMLNMTGVDDVSRAQIEELVVRKTGISIDKIVITPIQ